jgi:RNA polymerase sigma-70 factor, ECF subfamily
VVTGYREYARFSGAVDPVDPIGDQRADEDEPPQRDGGSRADAFVRELYADHGDFLIAFVLRLTGGDRHWAEDVVQETMVRAWRHAGQLLDGVHRSMLPWLTTVARRIVSNDRRSRRARPHEVDDTMLEVAMVHDDTERALQRIIIVDALRRIGPAHRQVVIELYLRGLSVEQVATVLNIPPGTVKSRSYYAMRALRAALQERGVSHRASDG